MALPISKRIPLDVIQEATNNFHQDNLISSGGGLGPAYKGRLLESGIKIVARRLDRSYGLGETEFLTEVSVLSHLNHPNVVSLIGYCDEKGEKVIVSSYAAKGSLSGFLNDPNLRSTQRLRICIGVASAMKYLHSDDEGRGYVVIHRNINSDTILLDENWEPKLSCFEISTKQSINRLGKVIPCEAIGVEEYTDPSIEKMDGVTYKSDTYSFGVVLFEILIGSSASYLCSRYKILDPEARRENFCYSKFSYSMPFNMTIDTNMGPKGGLCSQIAYSCTEEEPERRPDTAYIFDELNKVLQFKLQSQNQVYIDESSKLAKPTVAQSTHDILVKNQHLKIPLTDIKLATDYFSERYKFEHSKLEAYYDLYKVDFNQFDGKTPSTVVIKRFRDGPFSKIFLKEIEILTSIKNRCIVNLVGYCVEGSEKILVLENFHVFLFDYMEDVKNRRNFTWEKRLEICLEVGQAFQDIQRQMGVDTVGITWKMGWEDIVLDENFSPKIVNFEFEETSKEPGDDIPTLAIVVPGLCLILIKILWLSPGDREDDPEEEDERTTLKFMIDPILRNEINENTSIVTKGPDMRSLDTIIEIYHPLVCEDIGDKWPRMTTVITELENALIFQQNRSKQVIALKDINLATRNFHDDNYIGGGGFGEVYKGTLQDGYGVNTIVVKRLYGPGKKQFQNELEILWEYKHKNVINLVGYCVESDEKLIVYEYASRGSLDGYLNDASLTWLNRLNICVGVASALKFLHGGSGRQAKVVHRDIKAANILLNHDWEAKLADFGLSLISAISGETDYAIDHVCGTRGYVDPLYAESKMLTIHSDIYSFGVVLFEMLCGRSTHMIYKKEGQYLPDFVKTKFEEGKHEELVFDKIKESIVPKSLTIFQEIAYQCLHRERVKRPSTNEVLKELEKALEEQVSIMVGTRFTEDSPKIFVQEKLISGPDSGSTTSSIFGGFFPTSTGCTFTLVLTGLVLIYLSSRKKTESG